MVTPVQGIGAKITLIPYRKKFWFTSDLQPAPCAALDCHQHAAVEMTTRLPFKTTFEPERAIQPIFTGGSIALDNGAKILATTLGEDAVLTDLSTGRQLARIEGVRSPSAATIRQVHHRY